MLVTEIREVLKKYKEEDLRLLVTEMYKSMPKKLREDKDIDALLQDIHAYMNIGKVDIAKEIPADIQNLKIKVDQFVDYAYKQYYYAPNNYVHKKERPKWRFLVKAYVKSLQVVPIESADGRTATELLEKLYNMLSYACGYYIFNTEDPFRSVGIEQTELFDTVITRKLGNGISAESVKSAITLVINSKLDRETLHSSLICVLVKNLKTPDSKEIAIQQCVCIKTELEKSDPAPSKKTWSSDSFEYERRKKINNLVEIVFRINIALYEYEKAIEYFSENHVEREQEVSLYVLLKLLFEYQLKKCWLREYDDAVKKGIQPRAALQKTCKFIEENDKMPEHFLY